MITTTTTSADKSRLCSSARRALGPLDRSPGLCHETFAKQNQCQFHHLNH